VKTISFVKRALIGNNPFILNETPPLSFDSIHGQESARQSPRRNTGGDFHNSLFRKPILKRRWIESAIA